MFADLVLGWLKCVRGFWPLWRWHFAGGSASLVEELAIPQPSSVSFYFLTSDTM